MEVLRDLSAAYNKLGENDVRGTELLDSVGGGMTATQLDALLRQWSTYEKMLSDYENGTGSIAADAEKTAMSWEGSLNRMENSWTELVDSLTNDDAVIDAIHTFTDFLQLLTSITDKIGPLGTAGILGGAALGIENAGF